MAAIATAENIQYILKEKLKKAEDYILEKNPFMGYINKRTDLGGKYNRRPFDDASIAGAGFGNFGDIQASKNDMSGADWQITPVKAYGVFSIDHFAMTMCEGDENGFYDLVDSRYKNAMKRLRNIYSRALWNNHGNAIGRVATNNTTSIELEQLQQMWLVERGMYIQVATTDGTSGSVTANEIQQVLEVNRGALEIVPVNTFDADWNAGNYVFLRGGFGQSLSGVIEWAPLTPPSATPFFNVDRSIDDRRYGVIVDPEAIDGNLEEALITMAATHGMYGAEPDSVWLNPMDAAVLKKILGARKRYGSMIATRSDGNEARNSNGAVISFRTLLLDSDMGELNVMTDKSIPRGVTWMMEKEAFTLSSAGPLVGPLTIKKGDDWVPHGSEVAFEQRLGGYPQLECEVPNKVAVMDISSFTSAA